MQTQRLSAPGTTDDCTCVHDYVLLRQHSIQTNLSADHARGVCVRHCCMLAADAMPALPTTIGRKFCKYFGVIRCCVQPTHGVLFLGHAEAHPLCCVLIACSACLTAKTTELSDMMLNDIVFTHQSADEVLAC